MAEQEHAIPPHAPDPGLMKRVLGAFHVTGVFWYRIHRFGVSILPRWGVWIIVTVFSALFFVLLRTIRRAIADNLEPALGPCGFLERQLRIWRTMRTFAWCLSERYEWLSTDRHVEVVPENMGAWRQVAEKGGGFIMVSAHIGNYEIGAALPSTEEQRHVHLVREPEMDASAQEFVEELLQDLPGSERYTWHFEGDEPTHGLPLLRALARGEIVAVHGDRPRTGGRTVEGELFGQPFPLPAGPSALARVADVPLLPAFVLRTGRLSYRLVFREPIMVARSRDRNRDIEEATRRIGREVEWAIRQEPHQWFCFRQVWPSSSQDAKTEGTPSPRQG